jgi:sporulation protein YlmC with PRC-barrel domain
MTLELRGSARPTLQQALRWIGSRVDDIYGASVGKLEDIWMDPDTGEPLWLLVRDGRIGGRHTLVPFAQAASGAGHVWIPFEREVVRGAPAVRPSAPLSHELSDTLRRYYAENGHPVDDGRARTEEALRPTAAAQPAVAPTSRFVEPRPESPRVSAQTASHRRPAEPPRHETRRHASWVTPEHTLAPEPAPLPPMPSRAAPRRAPHQPVQEDAAPRSASQAWTPPAGFEAPAPPPPRREQPPRPEQPAAQPPPQEPQRPPTLDELRIAIGDGVELELVGRLSFRGSVVRMQPLRGDNR